MLAFENEKYTAYDCFHANGPYGEIPTKKDQSERSTLPQDYLPYNKESYYISGQTKKHTKNSHNFSQKFITLFKRCKSLSPSSSNC